jgi:hypothetical protein
MTKDTYFEMCAQLGQEPVDAEIPVDVNDFPVLAQQMLTIYALLEDRWDSMGGGYLGKNYATVFSFFELYEIETEEQVLVVELLQHVDNVRSKIIAEKIKAKSPSTK